MESQVLKPAYETSAVKNDKTGSAVEGQVFQPPIETSVVEQDQIAYIVKLPDLFNLFITEFF